MKLISRYDLASKSILELRSLYCKAFIALIRRNPESVERRNALASLENISMEIYQRYTDQWKRDTD